MHPIDTSRSPNHSTKQWCLVRPTKTTLAISSTTSTTSSRKCERNTLILQASSRHLSFFYQGKHPRSGIKKASLSQSIIGVSPSNRRICLLLIATPKRSVIILKSTTLEYAQSTQFFQIVYDRGLISTCSVILCLGHASPRLVIFLLFMTPSVYSMDLILRPMTEPSQKRNGYRTLISLWFR